MEQNLALLSTESKIRKQRTLYRYGSVQTDTDRKDYAKVLSDFIIDGYIRSECKKPKDIIFPISIKQIITSYYYNYNHMKTMGAFIDFKQKRQSARQQLTKYWNDMGTVKLGLNLLFMINFELKFMICLMIIAVIISIVAIIISLIVSDSTCNIQYTYSVIHPVSFIIIGCVAVLSHIILFACHRFIVSLTTSKSSHFWKNKPFQVIQNTHICLYSSAAISKWMMLLFYVVWSIIGFYIYHNDMSYDCKYSNIGIVMISWCIIIFVEAVTYYCWYVGQILLDYYRLRQTSYYYTFRQSYYYKRNIHYWFCWTSTDIIHNEYENIFTYIVYYIIFYPFAVISIIMMVICFDYTNSMHMIEPLSWTIAAAVAACLHILFEFIIAACCGVSHGVVSWIFCVFYFVWTNLGFYVYGNEMPSQFKHSSSGIVMLIWCIVVLISSCGYHLYMIRQKFDGHEFGFTVCGFYVVLVIPFYCIYLLSNAVTVVGIGTLYSGQTVCIYDNIIIDIGVPVYLIIYAGSTWLIFTFLLISYYFRVYDMCQSKNMIRKVFIGVVMVSSLFFVTLGIIGIWAHDYEMPIDCKLSMTGMMMSLWCIMMMIYTCCFLILVGALSGIYSWIFG
eukprot:504613_1